MAYKQPNSQTAKQPNKQHPKYRATPDFQSRGEFESWSLAKRRRKKLDLPIVFFFFMAMVIVSALVQIISVSRMRDFVHPSNEN
jgi:hypothetical protein